jgi:hypothetical protein
MIGVSPFDFDGATIANYHEWKRNAVDEGTPPHLSRPACCASFFSSACDASAPSHPSLQVCKRDLHYDRPSVRTSGLEVYSIELIEQGADLFSGQVLVRSHR